MNTEVLQSKTFEEWEDTMSFTIEESYIDENEILNKSDNPCYIAANADCLTDIVSYQDCLLEARKWVKMYDIGYTADEIVKEFFNNISWVFFTTYLAQLEDNL